MPRTTYRRMPVVARSGVRSGSGARRTSSYYRVKSGRSLLSRVRAGFGQRSRSTGGRARPFYTTRTAYVRRGRRAPRSQKLSLASSARVKNSMNRYFAFPMRSELVSPVYGSEGFTSAYFPINPTNGTLFPWISSFARSFTYFKFRSLRFEYKPTSGTAISGNNPALGRVAMVNNYDPTQSAFTSLQQIESYGGASTCGPWQGMSYGVNCKHKTFPTSEFYVRSASQNPGDMRWSTMGNFNICTYGMPADSNQVGELWVHYEFTGVQPINAGNPGIQHFASSQSYGNYVAYVGALNGYFGTPAATPNFPTQYFTRLATSSKALPIPPTATGIPSSYEADNQFEDPDNIIIVNDQASASGGRGGGYWQFREAGLYKLCIMNTCENTTSAQATNVAMMYLQSSVPGTVYVCNDIFSGPDGQPLHYSMHDVQYKSGVSTWEEMFSVTINCISATTQILTRACGSLTGNPPGVSDPNGGFNVDWWVERIGDALPRSAMIPGYGGDMYGGITNGVVYPVSYHSTGPPVVYGGVDKLAAGEQGSANIIHFTGGVAGFDAPSTFVYNPVNANSTVSCNLPPIFSDDGYNSGGSLFMKIEAYNQMLLYQQPVAMDLLVTFRYLDSGSNFSATPVAPSISGCTYGGDPNNWQTFFTTDVTGTVYSYTCVIHVPAKNSTVSVINMDTTNIGAVAPLHFSYSIQLLQTPYAYLL